MPKETFFNLGEEKQEKVMRSAIGEFTKHGFEKANVGTIAKNAEVAKGSMYQYFENKKEIFMYSVQWASEFLLKKYGKYLIADSKEINIFDYFYQTSKDLWLQMREERELVIFVQDVFLGKYNSLTDESMAYITKLSDEYLLQIIRDGKRNGYIRKDIDDNMLSLFMTGVSFKIKEYIMNRARASGEDLVDEAFDKIDRDIKDMIELLKNGMGAR